MKTRLGQSLVELLVVIAIAMVLLAIVATLGVRIWRAVMSLKGA